VPFPQKTPWRGGRAVGPPRVSTARAPLGSRKPGRPGATLYMERKNTKGGRRAGNNHSVGRVHRGSSRMERRLCEGGRRYRSLYSRSLAKGSVFFLHPAGVGVSAPTQCGVWGVVRLTPTYLPRLRGPPPPAPAGWTGPRETPKIGCFPPFYFPLPLCSPREGGGGFE